MSVIPLWPRLTSQRAILPAATAPWLDREFSPNNPVYSSPVLGRFRWFPRYVFPGGVWALVCWSNSSPVDCYYRESHHHRRRAAPWVPELFFLAHSIDLVSSGQAKADECFVLCVPYPLIKSFFWCWFVESKGYACAILFASKQNSNADHCKTIFPISIVYQYLQVSHSIEI